MLCKIAELLVEVPEEAVIPVRFADYRWEGTGEPDIILDPARYRPDLYPDSISPEMLAYVETGRLFSVALLAHSGLHLHASAVELDGKAYLFSAPSGTGKSTHTRLWQQVFGEAAQVFNDDKPALRYVNGQWYAYGTPWCGKDGIHQNKKIPLAGICFLKQAKENRIRRLNASEAVQRLIWQTIHRFRTVENMDRTLAQVDALVRQIPVFELENRPEPEAAQLSYETMRRGAEEANL